MVSMDRITWLVPFIFSTYAAGLFTVKVEKSLYKSEFRGDVVMGCSFQPLSPDVLSGISVSWHWTQDRQMREVYHMENGEEQLTSQDPDFRGRARLLKDELKQGWAKLQVSDLKISDSGEYRCFLQTAAGSDYKTMTVSVFAPFKPITKRIEKIPEREEVILTCKSKGYPQPRVTWLNNGQQFERKPVTTIAMTKEELLEVTTQINVTSQDKRNYTCDFTDQAAIFKIPDDVNPPGEKNAIIVVLMLAVALTLIVLIVVLCRCRHTGLRTATNRSFLVDALGRLFKSPAVTETKKESLNEEEKAQMNPSVNNDFLKTLLKENHLKWIQSDHTDIEGPRPSLYTKDGQELTLDDLVPANGGALLLEGSSGSGKTTVARMLLFSWTRPSQTPGSDFPDLSHLQLVVYLDCGDLNGTLFHEIVTQQSLEGVLSEDEARDVLTDETLLIVDGYKEGNVLFDESLHSFLLERRGCRVLITAGLEQSKVKELLGTEAIVQVQRQRQKY